MSNFHQSAHSGRRRQSVGGRRHRPSERRFAGGDRIGERRRDAHRVGRRAVNYGTLVGDHCDRPFGTSHPTARLLSEETATGNDTLAINANTTDDQGPPRPANNSGANVDITNSGAHNVAASGITNVAANAIPNAAANGITNFAGNSIPTVATSGIFNFAASSTTSSVGATPDLAALAERRVAQISDSERAANERRQVQPYRGNDPIKRAVSNPKLRYLLAGKKVPGPRKRTDGPVLRMGLHDYHAALELVEEEEDEDDEDEDEDVEME